jgi:hypothetical protein
MKTIDLPGFTAEASLYRSARVYGGSRRTRRDTASVVAAASTCFFQVQKCCGQVNPDDGTCDGVCVPKNQPCPVNPPSECIDQLGNEGCYPSVDGTLIKLCKCGSTGTCGPCFPMSVTVDTVFGFHTEDLGMRTLCRCDGQGAGANTGGGVFNTGGVFSQ